MKLKKEVLTQKRLKDLLIYNPNTGIFIRRIATGHHGCYKKGSVAGGSNGGGYIRIYVDCKAYLAHRLAFLWMEGYLPENEIDHKNRNRADNRWANLREVSRSCNARNRIVSKNNKSGVTGVNWCKQEGRWQVMIMVSGKHIHCGYFNKKREAAMARWKAEVKYGFLNCNTTSSAYQYLQDTCNPAMIR